MLDKRKAELGVQYTRKPITGGDIPEVDSSLALILKDGAIEEEKDKLRTRGVKPTFQLVDMELEE
jgi:hypothetical protein